jgi:hypothetical protein
MENGQKEFGVSAIYCKHDDHSYSLMIDVADVSVSLGVFCYDTGGMLSSIHITGINAQQMIDIADAIKKVANGILVEENKEVEVIIK